MSILNKLFFDLYGFSVDVNCQGFLYNSIIVFLVDVNFFMGRVFVDTYRLNTPPRRGETLFHRTTHKGVSLPIIKIMLTIHT